MDETGDFSIELDFLPIHNLNRLGELLDQKAGIFDVPSFREFVAESQKNHSAPRKPSRPIADTDVKQQVFDAVYRKALVLYRKQLSEYEKIIKKQSFLKQYETTPSGYAHFLAENFDGIAPFLNAKQKLPITEANRRLHTYITGGTGSGKSEAIKTFIWHYLTRNQSTGLVLLTPNGEIAEQVAQFWVNLENGRLVYIEPNLDGKHFPCLNPFDVPNKADLSDIEAEKYAEAFRSAFEELLQANFTEQMDALLKSVLPVIIKLENSSIYDLIDFLEPKQDDTLNEKVYKYLDFANKHIKNKGILDFLNGQFIHDDSYNRTKLSIHTRLRNLFNSTIMQAVMVGKSTLNIEQLIEQRKLLVFNFPKGKMPLEYRILGIFVLATVKIISFRRDGKTDFTPCHLFIDEFQNFITPSLQDILEESRKFGLFLTLAQQQAGARMKTELFQSILGNTAVKLTGVNETKSLKILATETGETVENLQTHLAIGRFSLWQKARIGDTQKPPVFVSMPTNTLKNKQGMSKEQWEALKTAQIEAFYRSTVESTPKQEKPQETAVLDEFDSYFN